MSNLAAKAAPAIRELLDSDDDQLYQEIALRLEAISRDPNHAGSFDKSGTLDVEYQGTLDDLSEFGRRFYERVNQQVYNLVCGGGSENERDRQSLKNLLADRTNFAAVLAAMLVAQLAMAPAVAAVVAALTVKLFLKPGYDVMCDMWKVRLPTS